MVHITLAMMVKNEQKRIHVSLNSIINIVDSLCIFDTGSTDNTISIIKNFCIQHKLPLRLKQGKFVDFSTSRNEMLDYIDTFKDIDYILMLDCNDELKNASSFRQFCEENLSSSTTAWNMHQQWFIGETIDYWNVRLIKPKSNWRYVGVVHEYITRNEELVPERIQDVIIYQDRTQDDDKTGQRFKRDVVMLLNEFKRDPEPRNIFYLAQTYDCLGDIENAYKFYKLRTEYIGFFEEIFQSYYRMAFIIKNTIVENKEVSDEYKSVFNWEKVIECCLKAYQRLHRVEPLIIIIQYYMEEKEWSLAYSFCRLAIELDFPHDHSLWIDSNSYSYKRYHLMGIVAYYYGKYEEGKQACIKAIEAGSNIVDIENLKWYSKRNN